MSAFYNVKKGSNHQEMRLNNCSKYGIFILLFFISGCVHSINVNTGKNPMTDHLEKRATRSGVQMITTTDTLRIDHFKFSDDSVQFSTTRDQDISAIKMNDLKALTYKKHLPGAF